MLCAELSLGFDSDACLKLWTSRAEPRIRLTLNPSGRRAFGETTREGAAILEGTVQNWLFFHANITKNCCFVVNSGITKGVLFGFR